MPSSILSKNHRGQHWEGKHNKLYYQLKKLWNRSPFQWHPSWHLIHSLTTDRLTPSNRAIRFEIFTIFHFLHNLQKGQQARVFHYNRIESLSRDKHSNFLGLFVRFDENEVLWKWIVMFMAKKHLFGYSVLASQLYQCNRQAPSITCLNHSYHK